MAVTSYVIFSLIDFRLEKVVLNYLRGGGNGFTKKSINRLENRKLI